MNSIENIVLPLPASPQIKVGRPFGIPPSVISSKPVMPVGVLGIGLFPNFGFGMAFIKCRFFFKGAIILK
jgi:hypothetical protein